MNRSQLKPRKIVVPLAAARQWRGGGGFIYQEKLDGQFAVRETRGNVLLGELLPDCHFVAFDIARHGPEDVRSWPLRERWRLLGTLGVPVVSTGNGGEFLEHVLTAGGEGIVAKELDAPFGAPMWAAKRLETFVCVVTGFCGGSQSVEIGDGREAIGYWSRAKRNCQRQLAAPPVLTVQKMGHVALRGGKIDRVRIGSLIKVEGFGLTRAGLIREPRVCQDTAESWLVRY